MKYIFIPLMVTLARVILSLGAIVIYALVITMIFIWEFKIEKDDLTYTIYKHDIFQGFQPSQNFEGSDCLAYKWKTFFHYLWGIEPID